MLQGLGALAGWFDYSGDCDMNEWQAREHILERVRAPGFIRGRRFETLSAKPRYFMLYETDDVSVFSSASYVERLNRPTDWTRRCSLGLANMTRSVCRIVLSVGEIDGGQVATLVLRRAIDRELLVQLTRQPGVYAAHLLEADRAASSIATVEKTLRGSRDRVAGRILILEGRDRTSLEGGIVAVDAVSSIRGSANGRIAPWRFYQLSFSATSSSPGEHRLSMRDQKLETL